VESLQAEAERQEAAARIVAVPLRQGVQGMKGEEPVLVLHKVVVNNQNE
jgi:hypothetical protein